MPDYHAQGGESLKNIPLATILLWVLIVAGYQFVPEIILREYIKYPLVILFSTLLPISFLLKQRDPLKRYHSLLFVGVFVFNIGALVIALASNYSVLTSFGNSSEQRLLPDLAELLTTEKGAEKRRFVAQIFYQKYGVSMPYKVKENNYTLYVPDQVDREHYRANSALLAEKETAKTNISYQIIELFFLLTLHAGIFFLVTVSLLIYEQKKPTTETT